MEIALENPFQMFPQTFFHHEWLTDTSVQMCIILMEQLKKYSASN